VVAELREICSIRPLVDCQDTIQAMISSKRMRLLKVKEFCMEKKLSHTVSYLQNARGDMFTAIENRLEGGTTSRVERLLNSYSS
jgi:hypothetical protein